MKKLFKFLIAVFLGFSLASCASGLNGVSIDKETLILEVGQEETLIATVNPSDAAGYTNITWASEDTKVVTVDANGKVVAVGEGVSKVTVTATKGTVIKKASCTVRVNPKTIFVSGVTLDKTAHTLNPGENVTLVATVSPNNAANKAVTWSTSNPGVATVDEAGKVSAVAKGEAVITVTTTDGNKTASCTITVLQPVTGVVLDKTAHTLKVGEDVTLVATVNPEDAANKAVTWSTSNAEVATVTNGKVVAVKAGSAVITVTTADGSKTASCTVTVLQPVTGVALDSATLSLDVGENATLVATVSPSDASNKAVTWTSNNESVATVDANGKVSAVAKGEAVITVKTVDGNKTSTCTVTVAQPVTGVSFAQTTGSVIEGQTKQLAAVVAPSNASNKAVTWESSNTAVATVNNEGLVTAVAEGNATITVTTVDGGFEATYTITVVAAEIPTTTITITAEDNLDEIKVEENLQLSATVLPADTTDSLTWSTSNADVATVSNAGLVTSVGAGEVTITATSGSKQAIYTIEVVKHNNSIANIENIEVTYGEDYEVTLETPIYGTPVVSYIKNGETTPSLTKPVNAGTYSVVVTIAGNYKYNELTKVVGTITINQVKVAKPTLDATSFVYTGVEQTYTIATNDLYTISGNKATNAGAYTVTLTLVDPVNYVWAEGFDGTIAWSIAKATPTIEVEDLEVELGGEIEVNYETSSDGQVTIKFYQGNEEVTPDTVGTYTIKVTIAEANNYLAIEAEAELKVVISTTSLEVSKTEVSAEVGVNDEITITVTPSDTTDTLVIESTDSSIATITSAGVVKVGKKAGTATITLTSGSFSKTVTVTVVNPWGTLENPITVDEAITLLARYGTDRKYTPVVGYVTGVVVSCSYSEKYKNYEIVLAETSDAVEFKVYGAYLADGVSVPVAGDTIVASGYMSNYFEDLYEFTKYNNVSPQIESVTRPSFDITTKVIDTEENPTISVTLVDLENKATIDSTVEFTITNENEYTLLVSANGVELTPVNGVYSFVITKATEVKVIVVEGNVAADSITITGDTSVELDASLTLEASTEPFYATEAKTWTSSDETIATVTNGVVTPLKTGTVTITVTTASGATDTHEITITNRWGTLENPISTEKAVELITEEITANNMPSSVQGYLKGIVKTEAKLSGADYSMYLEAGNNSFQLRYVSLQEGQLVPSIGDEVVVYGYFTKFNTTYQMSNISGYGRPNIISVSHKEYPYTVNYLDAEGATFEQEASLVGLDSVLTSGEEATFRVSLPVNHYVISVEFNGEELTATDGLYTISTALENVITVTIGENIAIDTVVISGATEVEVEESITLTAVVTPSNAKVTNIVWSAGESTKVSLEADGLSCVVTGLSKGNVTISFDCEELDEPVTYDITVKQSYAIVSVATFEFGENGAAEHKDGNDIGSTKTYEEGTYTLSLTGMSKVYEPAYDAKGNSCIKLGTSSVVGSFTFEVPENVTKVVINAAKYKANTTKISVNGIDYTLTKNSNDGEYDEIIVDTSTTKTVSFTTVSGGARAMVNSISFYEKKEVIEATGLTLTESTVDVKVGETHTLVANITPANSTDTELTWTSTNESVATVDENGVVTAIAVGTTTIKVQLGDLEATCAVTISLPVLESITLNKTSVNLSLSGDNNTIELSATANPQGAVLDGAVWHSEDETVATVDENGVVTAVAAGTTDIVITVGSISATCVVTVVADELPSETVTAKYTGTTTTNMTGNNDAAILGLDQTIFTVTSDKNGTSNHVGLNKDGTIRLYANKDTGEGNILTISAPGKTIVSIVIEFSSTVGSFTVNGTAGSKTKTEYEINSESVEIKNINTGATTQVRIKSIQITYK